MKAVVYHEYGSPDVLKIAQVEKPVPKDDEVLVKIHAASLNAYDWRFLRADPPLVRLMNGFLTPKQTILGADLAGVVESVGGNVTGFKPGDEVCGDIAGTGSGTFAEYAVVRANLLVPKPPCLSFEEAAAVPMAAISALQGLQDLGKIQSGQRVLIDGASGGVGTFAVQMAKVFGAHVTAVCSTAKMNSMRDLGADHVIDYTVENITRGSERYDLILGVNAYLPLAGYVRVLNPGGTYVMVGGPFRRMLGVMVKGSFVSREGKSAHMLSAHANREDLLFTTELIESGKVKPVVDRTYPLEEIPDAMRYMEQRHAKGKIVISVVVEDGKEPA
jgi:NADPH:quinone reductase-like Zn-dependent oxidoreductase